MSDKRSDDEAAMRVAKIIATLLIGIAMIAVFVTNVRAPQSELRLRTFDGHAEVVAERLPLKR